MNEVGHSVLYWWMVQGGQAYLAGCWRRCISAVDDSAGETGALGWVLAAMHFCGSTILARRGRLALPDRAWIDLRDTTGEIRAICRWAGGESWDNFRDAAGHTYVMYISADGVPDALPDPAGETRVSGPVPRLRRLVFNDAGPAAAFMGLFEDSP